MDKYIGRLLDGRYEILEEIGRGGMAVVYRARCHRLNRFVAVKILKDELSRDEDFRRRFHAESQAVAMLSHPNIMAVYDVNHSNDTDYIVMELLDGLTLKQYMQQRGVLTWREAMHFATQIAKALEHAHSRGIVHRDIKPHNIMILQDGSVKVADFGIARLNSSPNTLTREALGSVHYISPEQAKGAQVDARSDLYSLGVVMYEMLTGKPPYDGESPVAIAIQHINSTPLPPRQLNNQIPLGMQQITLHAMCSEISNRYASATAMIEDLEVLRKNPQIVFRFNAGPGGATAYVDPTAAQNAQNAQQSQPQQPQVQPVQTPPVQQPRPAGQNRQPAQGRSQSPSGQQRRTQSGQQPRRSADPQQAARQKAMTMAERSVERANQEKRNSSRRQPAYVRDEYEEKEERTSKGPVIAVGVLLLVVLVLGIVMWWMLAGGKNDSMVVVPNFLGQTMEAVMDNELYADFNLKEGDSAYSDKYPEGQICAQSITNGQKVKTGTTITLTVSKGEETSDMPDLIGKTQDQVERMMQSLINELGISVSYLFEESDEVEEGKVISTVPVSGQTIRAGDQITVTISMGEGVEMTKAPNVIGLEKADAIALLEQYGLVASVTEVENDAEEGLVFYQSIPVNTEIPEGTTVSIKVSLGRPEPSPSPSPSEEPSPSPSREPEEPSAPPTETPTPATPTPATPTPATPTPATPTPATPTPDVTEEPAPVEPVTPEEPPTGGSPEVPVQ